MFSLYNTDTPNGFRGIQLIFPTEISMHGTKNRTTRITISVINDSTYHFQPRMIITGASGKSLSLGKHKNLRPGAGDF